MHYSSTGIRRFLGVWIIGMVFIFQINGQNRPNKADSSINQDQILVKGFVQETTSKKPLEFATVSVFSTKDSTLLAGNATDENGVFKLHTPLVPSFAVIEYMGFETKRIDPLPLDRGAKLVDLGVLYLSPMGLILDEVEVRAEKSETQFSLDKRVFNVGKDLANKGGSAEDILDNVPSVSVDIDGNVSLRGSDGVRILIDGKPSGLVGGGNTNGLRSLPANLIEKVEVITNPSARFEAEGMAGIINIVLKKDKTSGFNGSFDLSGGYPVSGGVGANVNYRKGPINWFANYGLNYRSHDGGGHLYQEIYNTDNTLILDQSRNHERTGWSNSIRLGIDYFLSEKEQLTGAFLYRKSDEDNFARILYKDYINDFPNNLVGVTRRDDDEKEDEENLEYSLNYQKQFSSNREHVLKMTVQYRDESETESSDFLEKHEPTDGNPTSEFAQRSGNDEGEQVWLFQSDFVKPYGKDHKLEIGLRSSLRDINNEYLIEDFLDGSWQRNDLSNNFIYNEDIHSAYSTYGRRHGSFSYQLGLRAEWSFVRTELRQTSEVNDRDYLSLFPTAHLNYDLSETNAIQLSYSRRIRRPRFWDLNPFFTFSDRRTLFGGNPNLDPEFTHSLELAYLRYGDKTTLSGGFFYRHTTGNIERIRRLQADGVTMAIKPENLSTLDDYGLEVTFSYNGLKWWRLDGNANFFRTITDGKNLDQDFSSDDFTWIGRLTSRFTFWKDVDLQLRLNYRAPRQRAQSDTESISTVDVGLSKDFLKKTLTATFGVRDLFNSRKRRYETFDDDFYNKGEFQWRARTFRLNLNYRINQRKQRRRDGGGGPDGGFEGGF